MPPQLKNKLNKMKLLSLNQVISNAKTYLIPAYKEFPNSSIHNLPLIIYRPFADLEDNGKKSLNPDEVEELVKKNDLIPAWRYGMQVYST